MTEAFESAQMSSKRHIIGCQGKFGWAMSTALTTDPLRRLYEQIRDPKLASNSEHAVIPVMLHLHRLSLSLPKEARTSTGFASTSAENNGTHCYDNLSKYAASVRAVLDFMLGQGIGDDPASDLNKALKNFRLQLTRMSDNGWIRPAKLMDIAPTTVCHQMTSIHARYLELGNAVWNFNHTVAALLASYNGLAQTGLLKQNSTMDLILDILFRAGTKGLFGGARPKRDHRKHMEEAVARKQVVGFGGGVSNTRSPAIHGFSNSCGRNYGTPLALN